MINETDLSCEEGWSSVGDLYYPADPEYLCLVPIVAIDVIALFGAIVHSANLLFSFAPQLRLRGRLNPSADFVIMMMVRLFSGCFLALAIFRLRKGHYSVIKGVDLVTATLDMVGVLCFLVATGITLWKFYQYHLLTLNARYALSTKKKQTGVNRAFYAFFGIAGSLLLSLAIVFYGGTQRIKFHGQICVTVIAIDCFLLAQYVWPELTRCVSKATIFPAKANKGTLPKKYEANGNAATLAHFQNRVRMVTLFSRFTSPPMLIALLLLAWYPPWGGVIPVATGLLNHMLCPWYCLGIQYALYSSGKKNRVKTGRFHFTGPGTTRETSAMRKSSQNLFSEVSSDESDL